MARISYEGVDPNELKEFTRLLIEKQVSFEISFERSHWFKGIHWFLNGTDPSAVAGRDAEIIKEARELSRKHE